MEFKRIPIYCPKCKAQVMTYDGRSTIPKSTLCKCGKVVCFNPNTNTTKIIEQTARKSSSGTRWY